jgi:1-acyl-sn-glycerol-3-phosphate acyltransferase
VNRPHPWMPVSPCGQGCLPAADSVPTVSRIRQILRLLATAGLMLAGAVLVAAQPAFRPEQREHALRAWYRALLRVLHIQLEVTGGDRFAHPGVAILVVSNHSSWLDQIALGAVQPLRMVAKKELGRWPVVGLLARRLGTIFVDRERLSALPGMVAAITRALAGGAAVGAFPEGTTWCGLASGRFRPAVFQAAVDTATPVRPVALRYRLAESGPTTVACFVGTASLYETLVRVAGVQGLVIEVHLLPFMPATCTTRRILATRAETAVTACDSAPATGLTDWQCSPGSLSPQRSHGGCS